MSYSISLNNFKKIAAVATFLATIPYLVPSPAKAIVPLQISGGTGNGSFMSFEIDNSVLASPSAISSGYFPNAIKNFTFGVTDSNMIELEKNEESRKICKGFFENVSNFARVEEEVGILYSCVKFRFGHLTRKSNDIYEVIFDTNDDNFWVDGNNFTKDIFRNGVIDKITQQTNFLSLSLNFINPTEPIIIVNNLPQVKGSMDNYEYIFKNGGSECVNNVNENKPIKSCNIKIVPEGSGTTSLLGVGAIGTVLLLKRNRRYRKAASTKLTVLK